MKICLVSWAPFYAGAEVAALRLAVGLRDAGHEVVCAVGTDGELLAKLREAGTESHFIPTRFTDKWRWWSYRTSRNELLRLLKREQPDIIHSNDLPTHQMASDAARRAGVPRVCHHRWIFEQAAIDWFNKYGAERHLFVSRALMDDLCGKSQELAASEREVVYDGLPLPELKIVGRTSQSGHDGPGSPSYEAKQQLGLPTDKPLVLFAGQIIERKGVADVLHAWRELMPRWGQRAELVIVGDDLEGKGAYRHKMEQLAAELAVPARFVGFQKNVPTWLTAASVVLVPSHAEPLGNATLEAMAYARPVIGGNVGGIPEMIVSDQTGLLVPPKSPRELAAAIDRLLSDPDLAARMGAAARQRCEEMFSLEAHVNAVVRQYEIVLSQQSAAVLA
ncbi:MAG TPA: glycosyltransferase family 4 protein [Pirellulaceae bacterium]|nr:glycosyltransferase family 4 protein [Pirellulaceae bacterium]